MSSNNQPINIIFFGTSDFAEVILNNLLRVTSYELRVTNVVTQPDKPVGRERIMTAPPVKILAQKYEIPVWQPPKLDQDFADKFGKLTPDLAVVADYGQIIPKNILDIPKFNFLNVHPSLLPQYRGPSPMQTALLNGDKATGVTIIKLDEKMDHGRIISNFQFPISNLDTSVTLSKKSAGIGAELLIKTIPDYISGKIQPREQAHEQATYTKLIQKQDGLADWNKTAEQIYNQWRAYIQWPGLFTRNVKIITGDKQKPELLKYKNIKIQEYKNNLKLNELAIYGDGIENNNIPAGHFFAHNKKLLAKCGGESYLEILKLQPEGKKAMEAGAFMNGYLK